MVNIWLQWHIRIWVISSALHVRERLKNNCSNRNFTNRLVSDRKLKLFSLNQHYNRPSLSQKSLKSYLRHTPTSPTSSPLCQLLTNWDPLHHPEVFDRELPLLLRLHRLLHLHSPRPLLRVLNVFGRVHDLASIVDPVELFFGKQGLFFFPLLNHSLVKRPVAPLIFPLPRRHHRDIVHEEDTVLDFLLVRSDGDLKMVDGKFARSSCRSREGCRFSGVFRVPRKIIWVRGCSSVI